MNLRPFPNDDPAADAYWETLAEAREDERRRPLSRGEVQERENTLEAAWDRQGGL